MKVAHVNTSGGFSGGEVQVFLLLRGLRECGVESVLFCPEDSASRQLAEREGIATQRLRLRNDSDVPGMLRLASDLSKSGCELVHLHTGRAIWGGSIAARLAHLPVVATKRMDRVIKRSPKSALIWRRWVDRAVAISPAVEEHFTHYGIAAKRLCMIRSVVDPKRVAPQGLPLDARCEKDANGCTLLFAGSLHRRKGVDILVSALEQLRRRNVPVRAWILGDGPEHEALQSQISAAGLEACCILLGQHKNVADYLAAADIFVMPSRAEGMGIAALEAMAAALPVIASDVGGLRDSVEQGVTGLRVPAEDAGALAAAIGELVEDETKRLAMGEAGRQRIQKQYLPEHMVNAYLSLYREVLESVRATQDKRRS